MGIINKIKSIGLGLLATVGMGYGADRPAHEHSLNPAQKEYHEIYSDKTDPRYWIEMSKAPGQYQLEYRNALQNEKLTPEMVAFIRSITPINLDTRMRISSEQMRQSMNETSGLQIPQNPEQKYVDWVRDAYGLEKDVNVTQTARIVESLSKVKTSTPLTAHALAEYIERSFDDRNSVLAHGILGSTMKARGIIGGYTPEKGRNTSKYDPENPFRYPDRELVVRK